MLNIKGFAVINSLADNTTGVVSALGELSTYARTYTREENKADLVAADLGEVNFCSFGCKDETGTQVAIPQSYANSILTVTNWLCEQAKAGLVPTTALEVANFVAAEFDSLIDDVVAGSVVALGGVRLPSSLTWTIRAEDAGNSIQVWFSDSHFRSEYDDRIFIVIPPLPVIDSLFESSPTVQGLLAARTHSDLANDIAVARGDSPYTTFTSYSHNRVSIVQPSPLLTEWGVLCYGPGGEDVDAINAAIREYVMQNSAYDLEQWKLLIPSLFVNTEFTLIPYFDKIAIANLTVEAGQYSPIVSPAEIIEYAMLAADDLDEAYVSGVVNHLQTTHNSLALCGYGSPENVDSIYTLSEKWPDYIAVSTSSSDFARMDPNTQVWSQTLHALVAAAESMTPFSTLPEGIGRVTRSGKLFATKRVGNAQYLVYAKHNFS